jgi:predicted dehydrogenase
MGRFHAAKLKAHQGVEFVGCQDVVYERAAQLASEFGCTAFKSMDDLFGKVSAVLVAVPTQFHLACSLPFLENKIAVLVEKPIAPDSSQAKQIVDAAAKSGAILQIGHSERFNPVYQAARPKINKPRFVETHRLAPFKGRGNDVAVIYDLMIHDIDLLLDLTGSEPSSIEAAGVGVITDTFDIVNARLTFPTGCVANITASRISVKEMRKLRVFQQSGYISMDLATREIESFVLAHTDSPVSQKAGPFSKFNLPDGKVIVREDIEVPQGDSLQNEINSFIEAVMGVHPPLVSGKAGLLAMRVAEQIEKLCADYLKTL